VVSKNISQMLSETTQAFVVLSLDMFHDAQMCGGKVAFSPI